MRFRLENATLLCVAACNVSSALAQRPANEAPPPVNVKRAAQSADDFYVPLAPRFVAGPMATEVTWSPDGRYVSAVVNDIDLRSLPVEGKEPPVTVSLVIWSASTRRSTTVWSDTGTQSRISQVAWVPGSSVAFVSANWTAQDGTSQSGLWRVDARRSGATKVDGFSPDDLLYVSPTQPLAFVFGSHADKSYLKPLTPTGAIRAAIQASAPMSIPLGWTEDGCGLILPPVQRALEGGLGGDVPKVPWQVCDGRSGQITAVDKNPALYHVPERTYPFNVSLEPVKLIGVSAIQTPWGDTNLNHAWLEQGVTPAGERLLIAADAQRVEISPRGDAILYVNGEGAFVVGLLPTPKAALDKARTAAQRTEILNNGKQIALGVFMWSQDHEDGLPASADNLKDTLGPYIKSDAIWQGVGGDANTFVYTLNGGTMTDIKDPANTMMGYIPGPGGYAVVYSDGHVQWATDLPKKP